MKDSIISFTINNYYYDFWVNKNLVQSERTYILDGDEFDYSLTSKREQLNKLIENNSSELPAFV